MLFLSCQCLPLYPVSYTHLVRDHVDAHADAEALSQEPLCSRKMRCELVAAVGAQVKLGPLPRKRPFAGERAELYPVSYTHLVDEMQSPITTIPGMGVRMGAVILAEIGDFSRFDSPDKILAYAGMSPSTYQSGQLSLSGAYSHMEKRGSRYLRYALYNATKHVCHWDPTFAAYLAKKRAEGKHYNVALSLSLIHILFDADSTELFTLVALFHINRLAVSN